MESVFSFDRGGTMRRLVIKRAKPGLLMLSIVLLMVADPLQAQQQATQVDTWRAFAEKLAPGTLILVQLTDGSRIGGTLVEASTTELQVNPGRPTGPLLHRVPWSEIVRIERGRAGMTSHTKMVITAVVFAAALAPVLICAAIGGCGGY